MTDAQIRNWQASLEGRFYEGQVTDLDVNQLLEELVELRGRVIRLEGTQTHTERAFVGQDLNQATWNATREMERGLIYGQTDGNRR